MIRQPRAGRARADRIGANGNDLGHLEPTEQPVQARRVPHVSPCAPCDPLHRSEQAEVEKKVTAADTLARQVALRGLELPERGPPAGLPRKRTNLKIWIEVAAIFASDATSRQVLNERSERAVAPPNVSESRRRAPHWDGQGHSGSIR